MVLIVFKMFKCNNELVGKASRNCHNIRKSADKQVVAVATEANLKIFMNNN